MVAVQVGATFMPVVGQLNKLVRYAAEWRDDRMEYSVAYRLSVLPGKSNGEISPATT